MTVGEVLWEAGQVALILYCLMGMVHYCQKKSGGEGTMTSRDKDKVYSILVSGFLMWVLVNWIMTKGGMR